MCRLDRFLLSPSFELKFPLASQLAKPRPTSDHIPLILDLSDSSWGSSPFRFEILWFLENGFVEMLENWWNSFCFTGTPSEIFWLKLKELKGLLRVWNKDTFGHTTTKLQNIFSDIQVIDSVSESVCLSQDQVNAKISLQDDFEKVTLMEETDWRIKSKSKWIKEGDRNTAHFMRIAAAKRRYNRIRQLYIDGVMISDKTVLQEHIVAFYRTLFTEEMLIRPELEGINFDQINSEEATILESNFTKDEVYSAIKDLGNDKAPGPDDYPILFFFNYWKFLKHDLMAVVHEFCTSGRIDTRHNSTFIALVPKRDSIETIKDCRPIFLLTSVYKIISKVLATRLSLVMDKLISPVQCAYIQGRQIIDGTLIANEMVDSRITPGVPGLICKIDLEKAFDRVSWFFLEKMLKKMGFGDQWCKCLRFCYSTASFSVLINGTSFGHFNSSIGVRKGDPLSPLLFNIAMEGFSRYLDRVAEMGQFNGFSNVHNGIVINHLHYADDTIFFLNYSRDELHNWFSSLKCFELIAGLKINTSKRRIIPIGDCQDLQAWAMELGCITDKLPFIYLGMPLGAKANSKAIWDPILNKFDVRLSHLSKISVSKGENEKFLMGSSKTSHLVKWSLVLADKSRGGLGVLNLRQMNIALLAKWVWRFGVEKDQLWCRIIAKKHGSMSSYWLPGRVTNSSGISCWKIIVETSQLINLYVSINIHSGSRVSFWFDKWSGDESLCTSFPELFRLAKDKYSSVAGHISNGSWAFDFKRRLLVDEVNKFAVLLLRIGSTPPTLNGSPDTRRWTLGNNGVFSVKTLYSQLIKSDGVTDFPFKFVWNFKIPPNLVWCAVHSRLNTKAMLLHKGMVLDIDCVMCGNFEESANHLLLHCKVYNSVYWNMIPASIVWVIWAERNARTFEEKHIFKTDLDLIIEAKSLVTSWARSFGHQNVTVADNWDANFHQM
ncbi:uncharacterized protein LOC113294884 [Papaver somniferum]|uniref:uncharacterized protein LOC113294884 n=1 Tax=Papaver somniferum TaxID=3469 RepID=UPI000E6FA5A0|nr:uncharacterized protein LOC113294884 [Papaver somniferum]